MTTLPPSSGLIDREGAQLEDANTWTGVNTYDNEVQWAIADTIVVPVATAEMPAIANGNYADVDVSAATVNITTFATTGHVGTVIRLHFLGSITLENSANLELPASTNLTTQTNDELTFVEFEAGKYRCTALSLASGGTVVGSGYQLIKSVTTISGSNVVEFHESLTGNFSRFMVVCSVLFSPTNSRLFYRAVTGTTPETSANYDSGALLLNIAANSSGQDRDLNATAIDLFTELLLNDTINITIFIEAPPGVLHIQYDGFTTNSSNQLIKAVGAGTHTTATGLDGFEIKLDSTDAFNSGSIRLYGLPA